MQRANELIILLELKFLQFPQESPLEVALVPEENLMAFQISTPLFLYLFEKELLL